MSMVDSEALPPEPPPLADPAGVPMPSQPPAWNPSVDLAALSRGGLPAAPAAAAPVAAPPASTPPVNLTQLAQQAAEIKSQEIAAKEKIRLEEEPRLAKHRAVMEQRFAQTGVNPEDFKPWDTNAAREKYKYDPIEAFGSIGSVFAIIASAFTNRPMENAMLGAASAMNAVKAGNEQEYDRARKDWQDNTALAVKRQSAMHQSYSDAVSMVTTDMSLAQQRMQQAATMYGDKQMLTLLNGGMWDKAIELMTSRNKLNLDIAENEPKLVIARLQGTQALAIEQLPPGPERDNAVRTYKETWAAGKETALEKQLRKAQTENGGIPLTVEQTNKVISAYTEATTKSSGTDISRQMDAFDEKYPDATPEERAAFQRNLKGPADSQLAIANRKLDIAEKRGEELTKHRDTMTAIAARGGDTKAAEAEERARHNKALEVIAANKTTGGPKEQEVKRREQEILDADPSLTRTQANDRARRELTSANAVQTPSRSLLPAIDTRAKELEAQGLPAPIARAQATREVNASSASPSGNRIDDLKGMTDRITLAENVVDKIDALLLKHNAITGVGGMLTRPIEVIGNMVGSDESDRVQFSRYIAELKEILPRIITGSNARPLAAEVGNINKIAAGMQVGDTGANTLRAYEELRPVLAQIKLGLINRGTGLPGAAPAAAPAGSNEPAWKRAPVAQ